MNPEEIKRHLQEQASQLGFELFGVSDIELKEAGERLQKWLNAGYHGDMHWMASHGSKRHRPAQLVEGTVRCISVAMEYLPETHDAMEACLTDTRRAYISRYAIGRDYHKVVRQRLKKLAQRIEHMIGPFGYRVFTDSAPVMEKPIAEKAGLGWIGKHSNIINKRRGSWFFLGDIYTDLALPVDQAGRDHCGRCSTCMDVCPTRAIVEPYVVDARRCISYLTIEFRGEIPVELRSLMGNRIFGCDDCQLFCPWNRFATQSTETDFVPRHGLNTATLIELFAWSENDFDQYTRGSAIRRTGYESWLRNIAIALGNALRDSPRDQALKSALQARLEHPSPIVRSHVQWALNQG